MLIDWNTTF
jgi:tRNA U38,U39,U40 pseudouridine synthase TruA